MNKDFKKMTGSAKKSTWDLRRKSMIDEASLRAVSQKKLMSSQHLKEMERIPKSDFMKCDCLILKVLFV